MSKFATMMRAKVEEVIDEYEALVKERRVLKAIEKCQCEAPGSIRGRLCGRCMRLAQIRNKIGDFVWEWLRGEGVDWSKEE